MKQIISENKTKHNVPCICHVLELKETTLLILINAMNIWYLNRMPSCENLKQVKIASSTEITAYYKL